MTQYGPEFFRKFADIITEAEQPQQLNEGMMDKAKEYASKLLKVMDPQTLKQIATVVKQVTGGDYSLTKDNALKVGRALGVPESGQVSEGISPTLGGKIAQVLHLGAIAAAAGFIGGAYSLGDSPGVDQLGGVIVSIGAIAIMVANAFWSNEPGNLGSDYVRGTVLKPGVTPRDSAKK